jgi:hypothetical protein
MNYTVQLSQLSPPKFWVVTSWPQADAGRRNLNGLCLCREGHGLGLPIASAWTSTDCHGGQQFGKFKAQGLRRHAFSGFEGTLR